MEFVVIVLQRFFSMTREKATQVMLKVIERAWAFAESTQRRGHHQGRQVVGYARKHQHPLQCVMEET